MFAYFQGSGTGTAAVDKEIMNALIEESLIEAYHWTPDYIRSLPYRWIQRHLIIKRAKNGAQENQANIQKFHNQSKGLKPGQKTWREV